MAVGEEGEKKMQHKKEMKLIVNNKRNYHLLDEIREGRLVSILAVFLIDSRTLIIIRNRRIIIYQHRFFPLTHRK